MKANLNWFGQNTKTAIVIENTIAGFSIGRIEIDSPSNQLDLFPNLQFQNTKNHFEDFTSYQRLASHLELL